MSSSNAYDGRFARVFDYIEKHLGEEFSVERLSQVANFSKFHFHRQFCAHAGINVARYVQLRRLKRASRRLAFEPEARIIGIALDAGFETPESFARAFKREYGQTPSQFRQAPAWKPWGEEYQFPFGERRKTMDVKIVEFRETRVAVLEHRGPPERVNDFSPHLYQMAEGEWPFAEGHEPHIRHRLRQPGCHAARSVPLGYLRRGDGGRSAQSSRRRQQGHSRRTLRSAASPRRS